MPTRTVKITLSEGKWQTFDRLLKVLAQDPHSKAPDGKLETFMNRLMDYTEQGIRRPGHHMRDGMYRFLGEALDRA